LPLRARPEAGQPLLVIDKARKQFGGLVAVNDMAFAVNSRRDRRPDRPERRRQVDHVQPGDRRAAGDFRRDPLRVGDTLRRIDSLPSREIVKLGIGRTFQHVHLLPEMTVLENVAIGAHLRARHGVLTARWPWTAARRRHCCSKRGASWNAWAWAACCTSRRATWPWASSASSRSRGRCAATRPCCCSTSPRPACATRKRRRWRPC
jgi:hypothetical protein